MTSQLILLGALHLLLAADPAHARLSIVPPRRTTCLDEHGLIRPCPPRPRSKAGLIAGIILGVIGLILCLLVVWWIIDRRRNRSRATPAPVGETESFTMPKYDNVHDDGTLTPLAPGYTQHDAHSSDALAGYQYKG